MMNIYVYNRKLIKTFCIIISVLFLLICQKVSADSDAGFHIFGSPNPVGSGARAIGFGGTFIGIADDTTAASWNPGGLIELEHPGLSLVYTNERRKISYNFKQTADASGTYPIQLNNINFASISYAFFWNNRDVFFSLNYQTMYDFNKQEHANFVQQTQLRFIDIEDRRSSGYIKAVTPSFAFQLSPIIGAGVSLNLFSDDWGCKWQTRNKIWEDGRPFGHEYWILDIYQNEYRLKGHNFHFGLMIALTQSLNLGLVYKTAFTADLYYSEKSISNGSQQNGTDQKPEKHLLLKMPQSYGIGISWRPQQNKRLFRNLTLALDLYRTDWQHYFIIHPNGKEENLFSNNPRSECDTRPTYHVHAGGEYLFGWNKFDIPLRMGVFYDPEPTDYKPDDFWGFGMGTGLRIKDKYSLDLAWQFRWGNHVRKARLLNENVYQDIRQHMVYCSLTYYFSD
jgi:hypothetical protein